MKKNYLKLLFGLFAIVILLNSCNNGDDCCGSDDGRNIGKYVGIMVGSSGYFEINFSETNPSATVHFDGQTHQLSTPVEVVSGNDYFDLLFSSTDSDVSLRFSVNGDGSDPQIEFSIPGHQVFTTINYAESEAIELYEGTSHATNGAYYIDYVYNLKLNNSDNTYTILSKVIDSNTGQTGEFEAIDGSFSVSGSTIDFGNGLSGEIQGNTISHNEEGFEFEFVKVY